MNMVGDKEISFPKKLYHESTNKQVAAANLLEKCIHPAYYCVTFVRWIFLWVQRGFIILFLLTNYPCTYARGSYYFTTTTTTTTATNHLLLVYATFLLKSRQLYWILWMNEPSQRQLLRANFHSTSPTPGQAKQDWNEENVTQVKSSWGMDGCRYA